MRDKAQKDAPLVHRASLRVTGATVHGFNGLLQKYYGAITLHNFNVDDGLCDKILADSFDKVRRYETQLRLFK
jgi:hypothetical protein